MSGNELLKANLDDRSRAAVSRFFTVAGGGAEAKRGGGVKLHALEWPSSSQRALLLLHGGGAHAHWWDQIASTLADDHRVVALDFRGHGDSEHTPGSYGPDVLADDVEAVIDALGGTADLIGASMGGIVGLRVASRGSRIRRLIVVDSPPAPPQSVVENRAMLSRPKRYGSREEAIRRFRLMPPETTATTDLLRYVADHSVRPTSDGAWTLKFDPSMFATNPPRPLDDILPRVRCPVLYLRGERSALVSEEDARRVLRLVPGARTATIPAAYHHVFLDQPAAFLSAVKDFLASDGER